jgi:hypothetical protein
MKIKQFKKAIATAGLVIAITLIGFTLGFAHDGATLQSGYSLGLQHGFPVSASAPESYDLRIEPLPLRSGHSPMPDFGRALEAGWVRVSAALADRSSYRPTPRTGKVPLHLFGSILLI